MNITPAELGYVQPPPPVDTQGTPPGGGRFIVPEWLAFASSQVGGYNGYRWTFDEALNHSATNARAMRNDCLVMEAVRARQMPTALLSWHLESQDEGDPRQEAAIPLIEDIIANFAHFQQFRMHLLEAIWYGRAATQIRYRWDYSKDNQFTKGRRLVPTGYQYFNGDKLRFKFDGSVGVLVNNEYPGTTESTDFGLAHFLTPSERQCYVVHRFEPEDADWYEPYLAGGVNGYGIRGRIYWYWYLKQQIQAMLINYVERFSAGLTLWYFDASNPNAENEMKKALQSQAGATNMIIPRWGAGRDQNAVERLEVGTASPQFLLQLIQSLEDTMRRYILGQTLTSDTAPTGLGSGVAEAHSDTLSKIIKYDAQNLEETLTRELVEVLYRYNCPGVPPARFRFDVDTPNATEVLGNAQIMQQMGLAIDGDHLYSVTGLPRPAQGDTALTKLQPQSAVGPGVGPDPSEVPAAGDALPPDAQQSQPQQNEQQPPPDAANYASGDRVRYAKRRRSVVPRRRIGRR